MNSMYAKYTQTFYDFLKEHNTFLNDVIKLSSDERIEKLKNALISEYNLYEIGGETDEMFKIMFTDTFNQWKDYYEERISAYEKEYDYTVGNRRRTVKSSGINSYGRQESDETYKGKHTDIELPNKEVNDSYEGYPNNISKDENTDKSSKDYQNRTFLDDKVETIFDDEFLDLKRKYMEQLRNIYLEFAKKFKECFILIY